MKMIERRDVQELRKDVVRVRDTLAEAIETMGRGQEPTPHVSYRGRTPLESVVVCARIDLDCLLQALEDWVGWDEYE